MDFIEFGEEGLTDLQSVADRLFANINDPTSPAYQRVLVRPKISWLRIVISLLIPVVCSLLLVFLMRTAGVAVPVRAAAAVLFCVIYGVVRMKAAVICLVRIYQRFAPESVRRKCRFEPSCSVYMIQAVEKYGVIRGVRKGVSRLRRCKPGSGGFEPLD